MSSLFFTFFRPFFGTGFREPFYQFSLIWQDFFLTFFKFFVTLLLRFFTSFSGAGFRDPFYRFSLISQDIFPNIFLGPLIRSRRLAHPSGFPSMSLDSRRLHSVKRRFNEIGV